MSIQNRVANAYLIFHRKFRWTFEATFPNGKIPLHFVKVNARPGTLETFTITYVIDSKESEPFWPVLQSFYSNLDEKIDTASKEWLSKLGAGTLKLWDGAGTLLETWELEGLYPFSVNFGELDHSDSDYSTIEITWRYSKANYINPFAWSAQKVIDGTYIPPLETSSESIWDGI